MYGVQVRQRDCNTCLMYVLDGLEGLNFWDLRMEGIHHADSLSDCQDE